MQFNPLYPSLPSKLFHVQQPSPLRGAKAGHFNSALADELQWSEDDKNAWVEICSGQRTFPEFPSLAMVYAGHQFGQWAGQLGDGRGLLIAQILNTKGQTIDLHLKGAGPTPYSRMGDGRAVLRSVVREYLAGHALNALGVASSHAVGFTTSTQGVQREKLELGAMLLRTSECHIRLGHFEWINQYAPELLSEFTQKCIEWHYPECLETENPILSFAKKVVECTAIMIAKWQLVGFAHGVMNTDNLNITGSTLDFGPYGFMERFRPNWINNHSDYQGRYTYQNQPSIGHWNLWTWLNNLIPLAEPEQKDKFKEELARCLEQFEPIFLEHYGQGLCQKMGLPHFHKDSLDCSFAFLRILQTEQLDYTQSFIRLQNKEYKALRDDCLDIRQFDEFLSQYQSIREHQDIDELDANMQKANPVYILRNHMAQRAIEAAERDDFSEVDRLFKLLNHPYTKQPELEQPQDLGPLPSDVPDVAVSCSS
ncbi:MULTISPECIES: protein adenylyltransferase SelO [Acinetobacter]|uniref:protein adenylyltransferase SelO n=1 Tax=Acinetobacter TaxID=469 RepID=UPI000709DA36|nr:MULTISPECIES: YdiU family protein [Acinetobacter]KRI81137.1 selenoprotein O and cysteine-containing protein [Acinetobacter pittii]KRJ66097.1 selenoprotein O and cysteine-containing protein [Acinetobacter pittii]MBJ9717766.1 YdiU family protein [Acinetobacter pittii]MBJ9776278.1 YdiU family protein [Acinetobacter pittii]MDU6158588.1 YdiU family protein [Acinetobacter sp.]